MPQDTENRIKRLEQFFKNPDFELKSANILRTDKTLSIKERFVVGDREVKIDSGQRFRRIGVSSSLYSLTTNDYLIGVTSLSLAPSIGLPIPSLAGTGKTFIIKDEAGGAATTTITIRSEGEKNIDGATTATITTNYGAKQFYSDGANWFTL